MAELEETEEEEEYPPAAEEALVVSRITLLPSGFTGSRIVTV